MLFTLPVYGAAQTWRAASSVVVVLVSGATAITAHVSAGAAPVTDHCVADLLAYSGGVVGGAEACALGDPGAPSVIAADVPTAAMAVFFIAHWIRRRTEALARSVALVVVTVWVAIVAGRPFRSVGFLASSGWDAGVDGAGVCVVTEDIPGGEAVSEAAHIS
jgi:hypothetical protein